MSVNRRTRSITHMTAPRDRAAYTPLTPESGSDHQRRSYAGP